MNAAVVVKRKFNFSPWTKNKQTKLLVLSMGVRNGGLKPLVPHSANFS